MRLVNSLLFIFLSTFYINSYLSHCSIHNLVINKRSKKALVREKLPSKDKDSDREVTSSTFDDKTKAQHKELWNIVEERDGEAKAP